jgi:hypothetical protein
VALDDGKRKIVAGILRPEATEPEVREIRMSRATSGLFERLKRECVTMPAGPSTTRKPVVAGYEAGVSGQDLYRQVTVLGGPAR